MGIAMIAPMPTLKFLVALIFKFRLI